MSENTLPTAAPSDQMALPDISDQVVRVLSPAERAGITLLRDAAIRVIAELRPGAGPDLQELIDLLSDGVVAVPEHL